MTDGKKKKEDRKKSRELKRKGLYLRKTEGKEQCNEQQITGRAGTER